MLPETLSGHLCLSGSKRGGLQAAPVTQLPRSSHSTLWELMWTPWSHCFCFFNELVLLIYSVSPCQILTERFTSNQKGSYLAFSSSWMGVFYFFQTGKYHKYCTNMIHARKVFLCPCQGGHVFLWCAFACLFVQKSPEHMSKKFGGRMSHGPAKSPLNVGVDTDRGPDQRVCSHISLSNIMKGIFDWICDVQGLTPSPAYLKSLGYSVYNLLQTNTKLKIILRKWFFLQFISKQNVIV